MDKYTQILNLMKQAGPRASDLLIKVVGTEDQNPDWIRNLTVANARSAAQSGTAATTNAIRQAVQAIQAQGAVLQRVAEMVVSGQSRLSRWWNGETVTRKPTFKETMLYGQKEAERRNTRRVPGMRDRLAQRFGQTESNRRNTRRMPSIRDRLARRFGQNPIIGGAMGLNGRAFAGLGRAMTYIGAIIKGLSASAAVIVGVPMLLKSFSERVLANRREGAKFSGATAGAFARMEYAQIGREFAKAQATSETTTELIAAINTMRDALLPIEVMITRFGARVATSAAAFVGTLAIGVRAASAQLDFLKPIAEALEEIDKEIKDAKGNVQQNIGNALHDAIISDDFNKQHVRPPLPPMN